MHYGRLVITTLFFLFNKTFTFSCFKYFRNVTVNLRPLSSKFGSRDKVNTLHSTGISSLDIAGLGGFGFSASRGLKTIAHTIPVQYDPGYDPVRAFPSIIPDQVGSEGSKNEGSTPEPHTAMPVARARLRNEIEVDDDDSGKVHQTKP